MTVRNPDTVLDEAEAYLELQTLPDGTSLLAASGSVLYSSVDTLKPGPVYFLGLNPGGGPQNNPEGTLGASLRQSRAGKNEFAHAVWGDPPRQTKPGQSILQRRVKTLFAIMGLRTCSVPASNLVFTRSRNLKSHGNFSAAVTRCKPVHDIFLNAIRPRLILTHGNHALVEQALSMKFDRKCCAEHGSWQIRKGHHIHNERIIHVLNLPHLSFWAMDAITDQGAKRGNILRSILTDPDFNLPSDPRVRARCR